MKHHNKAFAAKWMKYGIVFATMLFGILPSGCETRILRFATPFLI